MKKLLNIGFANIIWSILPIIFWNVAGMLFGTSYNNGFIIGYSFQFITMFLSEIFLSGSLKAFISDDDKSNYFGMGFICYVVIGICICVMFSLFGSSILQSFGYKDKMSQELYKIYVWQFMINGAVMGISRYFQYKEKIIFSQVLSYSWFVLCIVSLFICRIYTDNGIKALNITNTLMFMLCFMLTVICIDFKNMKFDLKNWFCREGYNISNHLMMFIIYFLGVGDMSGNAAFITAYNINTMCTDIQWDMEGSIDTYTATEASFGDWDKKKKKIFYNVMAYSILSLMISLVFVLLSDNRMVLYIWIIEMSMYIPDCIGCYLLAYVSIVNPNKWMLMLGFIDKVIRLFVQIMIPSQWGIPIACFVGCFVYVIGTVYMYYKSNIKYHL